MGVYFLWKRTPHGMIRVSHDGLSDFVRGVSLPGFQLHSLALAAAGPQAPSQRDETQVTLVFLSRQRETEKTAEDRMKNQMERRLSSLMTPMGMRPCLIWASRGAGRLSPWGWMALASSVALVVMAGWAAFFWTAFWGTAAWFLARGLVFLRAWMGAHHG